MLTWFIKQFCDGQQPENGESLEKTLDRKLGRVAAGSDGLYLQPFWNPGLKSPEAKGSVIGFSHIHTYMHLYRAMIEGINYELINGLRNLERNAKTKVKRLMISGGGASSDEVLKITADMFGLPVSRVQTHETSGLGAAICAFVGLGRFGSYEEAIKNMVHVTKTFLPDPATHEFYKNFFQKIYKGTYKRLKPTFMRLKEF